MGNGVELREQLAHAISVAGLAPDSQAVDLIGALGASQLIVSGHGDLHATGTRIGERGRIAALLTRAKLGNDIAAAKLAVVAFGHFLERRRLVKRANRQHGRGMAFRIAAVVVTEALRDRCAQCGGAGVILVGKVTARNSRTEACRVCQGGTLARVDHGWRAQALGLTMASYDAAWKGVLADARGALLDMESGGDEYLRSQMRRGKVRSTRSHGFLMRSRSSPLGS